MPVDFTERHALVLAVAHEIGNHLGGIRLEAHLLGDDLGPRALARASVTLDGLAGRSGSLLSLIRPLLHPEDRDATAKTWTGVLAGVRQELQDQGTQGVELTMDLSAAAARETTPATPSVAPPVGWMHPLLTAWLGASIAQVQAHLAGLARDEKNASRAGVSPQGAGASTGSSAQSAPGAERGHVRLAFLPGPDEARIIFEDSAPAEDLSEAAPRRERPLALAIARILLGDLGGRVEVEPSESPVENAPSRVVWVVPNVPSVPDVLGALNA
ncbi:MAG: hypothetical protein AB8G23_21790 [Myxococcota bacterium]